jgi:glycosyltransferase involved in cell wall biosynthesis
LIVPEAGLVNALNIGLAMIQHFAHPEDWVCKFDDDDLYGRDYVERVMRLDPSAQAAGRTHVWVRSQSQRLWGLDFGDINTNAPHGPTLAARAGCFLPFKRQRCPWGEDSAWWSDMRAAGVRFHDVGRDGFCWVRSNDAHHKHSYPFADNEMRDTAINGVYDYGEFDVRVAMGEAPTPPGQLLPQQDLDFAAYEAAINKTINEVSYG